MTDLSRRGDWMQTHSGTAFWPLDPLPEDVSITDIAHALSHLCRYAGHTHNFYSVAQHSVLVSRNLPAEHAMWGLLHDAAEAYVVDIPRPLKRYLKGYAQIEAGVLRAIAQHFELPPEIPAEVKRVDNAILADESVQLMGPAPRPWVLHEPPLGIKINIWTPRFARSAFIHRYLELIGEA